MGILKQATARAHGAVDPSAIVAAELRVVQSRRELRDGLRRLRYRLSRPSFLAAAAAVGALLVFSLTRRGRTGAVVGLLATALIRRGVQHLLARADASRRIGSSGSSFNPN